MTLFVINALGEPMEFTYTRIDVPNSFLWRKADIARHAIRKMAGSLFNLTPASPRLVFCLSSEINIESFLNNVKLNIPLCGVSLSGSNDSNSGTGTGKQNGPDSSVQLAWFPAWPAEDSLGYQLFKRLLSGGLILEPFERAAAGLREVYK
jgi:hypothetical protein